MYWGMQAIVKAPGLIEELAALVEKTSRVGRLLALLLQGFVEHLGGPGTDLDQSLWEIVTTIPISQQAEPTALALLHASGAAGLSDEKQESMQKILR